MDVVMMLLPMALLLLPLADVLLVAVVAAGEHQDGYDDLLQNDLLTGSAQVNGGGETCTPIRRGQLLQYDSLANLNAYHPMQTMEDEDWDDLVPIDSILSGIGVQS